MMMGKIVPLFGAGQFAASMVVTRQRRLNVFFERRADKDKGPVVIYGTDGLVQKYTLTTPLGQPVRALLGTQTKLLVVAYNQFQDVAASGYPNYTANLSSLSGQCSIALNAGATQAVIADGISGYLYTPASPSFTTLGASFPSGAQTVAYVSGFFVAEQPGTPYFWTSNANDGSTWNALAYAASSQYSDTMLAVDNLAGNLVLFAQQHLELWQNVGTTPVPYNPITSAVYPYGLAAIFSRAHIDQSIIFLARNAEGQLQFVQLVGYEARPISTPDIEWIINQFAVTSDAVALAYGRGAHKFYQVTFPTQNRSFLFDSTTGLWSDVQTGTSLTPVRHQAQLATYYAGTTLLSDYATNVLYTMSPTAYTDNGTPIVRELITRHLFSNYDLIRISSVYLDMETGVGLQSGQGANPFVMLQYSKDNGRTWSAERWASVGAVGLYRTRVLWRRFGRTRDALFRIRMTDPVKFVVIDGALKIKTPGAKKMAA